MFSRREIENALGVTGLPDNGGEQERALWTSMLNGKAPWNDKNTPSLRLASSICVEVARSVSLEFSSSVTGSIRAEFLQKQCQRITANLRTTAETLCSGGMLIFKPYVSGGQVYVTVVTSDNFLPVKRNSRGELTDIIFTSTLRKEKQFYTLAEHQAYNETAGICVIVYRAFISDSAGSLGKPVPLASVPEYAALTERAEYRVRCPLFVPVYMPRSGPDARGLPLFAKASELIREADRQFARALWEYEGGELAIDASLDLFRKDDNDNAILPAGKERLFRALDAADPSFSMKAFSPELRDASLFRGLNEILRRIEFTCGLSYGILSDPNDKMLTATEIKASRQRLYATVTDIQKTLEDGLRRLAAVIDALVTIYNLSPTGAYELAFNWDDSIVADRQTEFEEKARLVSMGILRHEEFRAWYMGETLETARQNLPELARVLD